MDTARNLRDRLAQDRALVSRQQQMVGTYPLGRYRGERLGRLIEADAYQVRRKSVTQGRSVSAAGAKKPDKHLTTPERSA
jgi:hypothetical protein